MVKKKILHIAAHMGEGVGKAISGLAIVDKRNIHEIILLEKPNKMNYIDYCRNNGVSVIICPNDMLLTERVSNCDIVIMNWWNHPSMIPVFHKLSEMPTRILLWSHVNGLRYPQLSSEFASIFDECLFTSPISLRPPHWTEKEKNDIQKKSQLVYGMGEFKPSIQPLKNTYDLHNPIRIGYVGTLDYSKMHPDFLTYCKCVLERGVNACFVLAGEPSLSLLESVERENLTEYFQFLGFRKDVPELLTSFDVFGYLLNPNNFATTENALLEAMAAGLPIISGNSEAEIAIISNGVDGFCVDNEVQYAKKIDELASSIQLRRKLGICARASVCKKYDVDNNVSRFNDSIIRVMDKNKVKHDFNSVLGDSPFEYFLANCSDNVKNVLIEAVNCNNNERFCELKEIANGFGEIFKTNKKGSPLHFLGYFPTDMKLQRICELFQQK